MVRGGVFFSGSDGGGGENGYLDAIRVFLRAEANPTLPTKIHGEHATLPLDRASLKGRVEVARSCGFSSTPARTPRRPSDLRNPQARRCCWNEMALAGTTRLIRERRVGVKNATGEQFNKLEEIRRLLLRFRRMVRSLFCGRETSPGLRILQQTIQTRPRQLRHP
eukprot:g5801.t1